MAGISATQFATPAPALPVCPTGAITDPLRIFAVRARDLEALSRFELNGRASYKQQDLLSVRDFRKHHTDPHTLILMACWGRRQIAGYLVLQKLSRAGLLAAWNVEKRTSPPGFALETLHLLLTKAWHLPNHLKEFQYSVLVVDVRERELAEQIAWRSLGFHCEKIKPDAFDYPPDSAYRFYCRTPPAS